MFTASCCLLFPLVRVIKLWSIGRTTLIFIPKGKKLLIPTVGSQFGFLSDGARFDYFPRVSLRQSWVTAAVWFLLVIVCSMVGNRSDADADFWRLLWSTQLPLGLDFHQIMMAWLEWHGAEISAASSIAEFQLLILIDKVSKRPHVSVESSQQCHNPQTAFLSWSVLVKSPLYGNHKLIIFKMS